MPKECSKCGGFGCIGEDARDCPKCNGTGETNDD